SQAGTDVAPSPVPPAPATIEQTGLSKDQIVQLFIKSLYTGEASGTTLADRLRLSFGVLQGLVEHIRAERLVEVRGAPGTGSAGFRYALTALGRDRARQYLDVSEYVGAAPVPLAAYVEYMNGLRGSGSYIGRERLEAPFAHMVMSDEVLGQLGPAVNA